MTGEEIAKIVDITTSEWTDNSTGNSADIPTQGSKRNKVEDLKINTSLELTINTDLTAEWIGITANPLDKIKCAGAATTENKFTRIEASIAKRSTNSTLGISSLISPDCTSDGSSDTIHRVTEEVINNRCYEIVDVGLGEVDDFVKVTNKIFQASMSHNIPKNTLKKPYEVFGDSVQFSTKKISRIKGSLVVGNADSTNSVDLDKESGTFSEQLESSAEESNNLSNKKSMKGDTSRIAEEPKNDTNDGTVTESTDVAINEKIKITEETSFKESENDVSLNMTVEESEDIATKYLTNITVDITTDESIKTISSFSTMDTFKDITAEDHRNIKKLKIP